MAPVITSLSAAPQGTNQGSYGQTLTINGAGMTGATAAKIGSRTVPATANPGGTVVTCALPSGCGPVSVSVVAPSGTSNSLPFYYIDSPFVSSLTPAENSAQAPHGVTIAGETLLTTNRVRFSGTDATLALPITSDASIVATPAPITPLGAPPWFQSLNLEVRTSGGSFTLSNAALLFDTPAITALDPITGTVGTQVIITGTGFVGSAMSVTFAGVEADFTINSDTQILAFAPTNPVGAADVVVSTPGGPSAPATFTYA
ncbi:IPT/TIG domain-containing protein [Microbispora sp. CA-135349]|uniref:IPT/TIG domain-containing protein n=1 Tax=Microbispora sp. CA-135349 TaxID=3239953 RepID=UPI003D8EA84A